MLGDLNDATRAVTTDIVMGDEPSRFWPRGQEQRRAYWDRVLYSAHEINARLAGRDVSYTHIFNGHYENLDHILVSQEFFGRNPEHIGGVANVRHFNDHLFDSRLSNDDRDRIVSDHAQLVAEIRLRDWDPGGVSPIPTGGSAPCARSASGMAGRVRSADPVRQRQVSDRKVVEMSTTTPANERDRPVPAPLARTERCDRCGAAALVVVSLTTGGELHLCGHHTRKHAARLLEIGAVRSVL